MSIDLEALKESNADDEWASTCIVLGDLRALVEIVEPAQAYVVVGVLDPDWRPVRARLVEALKKVSSGV